MIEETDIQVEDQGVSWGHTRSYRNAGRYCYYGKHGSAWNINSVPVVRRNVKRERISGTQQVEVLIYSVSFTNNVVVSMSKTRVIDTANPNSGTSSDTLKFIPRFGTRNEMWEDSENNAIFVSRPNGDLMEFYGFSDQFAPQGFLKSVTSPSGETVELIYDNDRQLIKVQHERSIGGQKIQSELLYTYSTEPQVIQRKITQILLRKSSDNGVTWKNRQEVEYFYCGSSDLCGPENCLKKVVKRLYKGNTPIDHETLFYRYYTENTNHGSKGSLKYVFNGADYYDACRILGNDAPSTASDDDIKKFASNYFGYDDTDYEYDEQGRLIKTLEPRFEAVNESNQAFTSRPCSWTVYDDVLRRTMTASGYAAYKTNGTLSQYHLINPVSITLRDPAERVTDQIKASRGTTTGELSADDTFDQSSYKSWTRSFYDAKGELEKTWQYFSIPEDGDGTKNVDYLETSVVQEKSTMGDKYCSVDPDGTITRTVYDWRGNAIQTWVGTNDTGAGETNPHVNNGLNDMQCVSETDYGVSGSCSSCSGAKDKVLTSTVHPDAYTSRVTEYEYDWRGRQIKTINDADAAGNITYTLQTYDNMDRVIKSEVFLYLGEETQPRLLSRVEYSLDSRGQVWKTIQSKVEPTTGVVQGTLISQTWYDPKGRVKKSQSPGEHPQETTYNSLGNVSQTKVAPGNGWRAYKTDTIFDSAGNAIIVVEGDADWDYSSPGGTLATPLVPPAESRRTAMWYDGAGRPVATANYGKTTYNFMHDVPIPTRAATVPSRNAARLVETKYDSATGQAKTFDYAGRESRTVLDAMGRVIQSIPVYTNGVNDPVYQTEYDTLGRVVAQIDPLGNRTETEYGRFGRVTAVIDPKGNRRETSYNLLGEVVLQKDEMNRDTSFDYDDLGRRIKTIFPPPTANSVAPEQITVYNVQGLVAKEIDPLGHETLFEYDGLGRMVKKIDALGGEMSYTYSDRGNILSVNDPVNNTTTYGYDPFGRLVKETNQFGHSRTLTYSPGGLLTKKTDRNGRITEFTYNNYDEPTHEKWCSGITYLRTITSVYDGFGRLTSVADPSGTHAFVYDNFDHVTKTTMTLAGLTPQVVLDSTFDLGNRQLTSAVTIGTTKDYTKAFGYDANSQVTSIVQQQQAGGNSMTPKRVEYTYNAARQRTAAKSYAATTATDQVFETVFSYDGMGRLTDLTHKKASTVYADYDITWDAANRITDFDFTYLNGGAAKTTDYGYDNTDQLKTAAYSNGFQTNESCDYDANGNRNANSFTVGVNNRLTSDGTFNYTYDNEGNRLTKTRISNAAADDYKTEYTWDYRNRLAGVTLKNNSGVKKKELLYDYDHQNRLVRRKADNDGNGSIDQTDIYVHEGYQIALQFSAASANLTATSLTKRYLWGANQDELLADETASSDVLWAATDHLGSVRDLLRLSGSTTSVANHLTYNAFGLLVSKSSATAADNTMFAYTGKWTDAVSNLQWNVNRWYDAPTGKWISEDPIGFDAGDVNLYRYVRNAPVELVDYLGLVLQASPIEIYVNKWEYFRSYKVYVPNPKWDHSPNAILENLFKQKHFRVWYNYKSEMDYQVFVHRTTFVLYSLVLVSSTDDGNLDIPVAYKDYLWTTLTPEIIEQNKDNLKGQRCLKTYFLKQKCTECSRDSTNKITGLKTKEYVYKHEVVGRIIFLGVAVILGGDFVIFGKTGGFVDIPKRFPTI